MYVLLVIAENPGISKTKLMRLEEGYERTKFLRIQELIEAGYVRIVEGGHWKSMPLELTEKGMRAARSVEELKKL